MEAISIPCSERGESLDDGLFGHIAEDIRIKGYSINPGALPAGLTEALIEHLAQMNDTRLNPAGIGRELQHMHNRFVRKDEICWITGESTAGSDWLAWAAGLQAFLNRCYYSGYSLSKATSPGTRPEPTTNAISTPSAARPTAYSA